MFLAIDIGNTNIVYAVHDGAAWKCVSRQTTNRNASVAQLSEQIATVAREKIAQVGIASVVPMLDAAMSDAVTAACGVTPNFATTATYPYPIRYPKPEEIGADRLADAAGALAKYSGPLLIIDFGTATTFDYIGADGAYYGGPIAPGILLGKQALSAAAAKLPDIEFALVDQLLPTTTAHAMQAGLYFGAIGAVKEIVRRMQNEIGAPLHIIATGGLAASIVPALDFPVTLEPQLTIEGIRCLLQRVILA